MRKTVLILGANGRFGRHTAEAFWNAGWSLRFFERGRDDLTTAAQGADVIVAGWNPPYPQWTAQLLAMHQAIRNAARHAGATVILPANVYVFGERTPPPWGPNAPHAALNALGRVRIETEQGYRDSGVQTIVLRAGDFIDTEPSGGWLDRVMLRGLARGQLVYPGRLDIPHAWAYLPDLACAAEMLAARRADLDAFTDVGFPGYTLSGADMAALLSLAASRHIHVKRMSWLPLQLAAPVWPMARCLLEMRYLWNTPHGLEDEGFKNLCPDFRPTDAASALARVAAPWIKPTRRCGCPAHSMMRSTQTSL